jgi:hypothetical protein
MHAWALPAAIKVACDDAADAGGGDTAWTAAQTLATSASAAVCRNIWCCVLLCQAMPGRHIPLPNRRRIQRRHGHVPPLVKTHPSVPVKF